MSTSFIILGAQSRRADKCTWAVNRTKSYQKVTIVEEVIKSRSTNAACSRTIRNTHVRSNNRIRNCATLNLFQVHICRRPGFRTVQIFEPEISTSFFIHSAQSRRADKSTWVLKRTKSYQKVTIVKEVGKSRSTNAACGRIIRNTHVRSNNRIRNCATLNLFQVHICRRPGFRTVQIFEPENSTSFIIHGAQSRRADKCTWAVNGKISYQKVTIVEEVSKSRSTNAACSRIIRTTHVRCNNRIRNCATLNLFQVHIYDPDLV
jgi:hypothetical protein